MARRIWLLSLAFAVTSCGSSDAPTPVSNGSTVSTTIASSTTTTTILPQSLHYVGTIAPAGSAPLALDLSLFFSIPGGSIVADRSVIRPAAASQVTGGYRAGTGATGFSGTVRGTAENSVFTGVLTTTLSSGCVASRNYSGPLTSAAINWAAGNPVETCGGASPLTFSSVAATVSGTVTTVPTSCTYALSIGSTIDGYPTGGSFPVTITAPSGCSWTASSTTTWIHVPAGTAGNGSGSFTFTADANNTTATRTGELTIAGNIITFRQTLVATTTTTTSTNVNTVPCNQQNVAGGDAADTRTIELGKKSGAFQFQYDTVSIPDRITVSYEGKLLFDTGCVGASGTRSLTFSGNATTITVQVTPNCAGGTSGTSWSYLVSCP